MVKHQIPFCFWKPIFDLGLVYNNSVVHLSINLRFSDETFFLIAIFILYSRESELYRYSLDGTSTLALELPFLRGLDHLYST